MKSLAFWILALSLVAAQPFIVACGDDDVEIEQPGPDREIEAD